MGLSGKQGETQVKTGESTLLASNRKQLVTMFSSISTMFWGEEQDGSSSNASVPLPRRDESPAGDDWVLVGSSSPAPGDLGALEPLRTPASSAHSSNLPSSTVSEAGDEEAEPEPASTRVVNQRPNAAPSRLDALAMAEAKSLKSAQLEKQRNSGKTLSSKALKRQQLEARGGGQEGQLQEVKLPDQNGRQQEPEAVLVDLLLQKNRRLARPSPAPPPVRHRVTPILPAEATFLAIIIFGAG